VYDVRGHGESEAPHVDVGSYTLDTFVEDQHALMAHLGIEQAYIGGLSMGGSTTLHFGIRHPEMAKALIVAAAVSGSTNPEEFGATSRQLADDLESQGAAAFERYGSGPTRVQLRRKDPAGFQEFMSLLTAHSTMGSAHTMRGVQAGRPPIFHWQAEMQALQVPTLVLVGDEDEPCIEPSLFMKRNIPHCGLVVFPQSGHAINLEEPALFNHACLEFLHAVEAGKWA
jgi:pimeloyl-ACP methyl ester carboxylesterase